MEQKDSMAYCIEQNRISEHVHISKVQKPGDVVCGEAGGIEAGEKRGVWQADR